jgi:hypothetical protein
MTPSLRKKLAKLVTLSEEVDQGGVTYGDGQRRNVWPEVQALLRDPELTTWMDNE